MLDLYKVINKYKFPMCVKFINFMLRTHDDHYQNVFLKKKTLLSAPTLYIINGHGSALDDVT
jgi:hypothetical protein